MPDFTGLFSSKIIPAYTIFIITLSIVFWQPRLFGVTAMLGAIVALLTGVVQLKDIPLVWGIVGNATITLVALIIISLILDEAGVFRWLAYYVARWGGGKGRILFRLVIILAAVVTALLTNDGTVLILTPVVLEMCVDLNLGARAVLAFVVATGFIADASSLPFTVSNLTNIITADYFNISFSEYARVMIPVNMVAVVASVMMLWLYFYPNIPPRYNIPIIAKAGHLTRDRTIAPPISDRVVFYSSFPILLLLLGGYFFAEPLGISVSLIASFGALILLILAGRWLHPRGRPVIPLGKVLSQAPWQVIFFSLGMYLIVLGLHHVGLTTHLTRALAQLSRLGTTFAIVGTGVGATLLSGVMNNLPTVLIDALAIKHTPNLQPQMREAIVYANLVGCTLGAKITPIGSLGTLLWLEILASKGVYIDWLHYLRIHLLLTLPVLLLTLLSLAVWLNFLSA